MLPKVCVALVAVAMLGIVASVLFFIQGGFGAGHGRFDNAIFIMGLPWAAMPWPSPVIRYDFVWLIGLPLILNATSIVLIAFAIRTSEN